MNNGGKYLTMCRVVWSNKLQVAPKMRNLNAEEEWHYCCVIFFTERRSHTFYYITAKSYFLARVTYYILHFISSHPCPPLYFIRWNHCSVFPGHKIYKQSDLPTHVFWNIPNETKFFILSFFSVLLRLGSLGVAAGIPVKVVYISPTLFCCAKTRRSPKTLNVKFAT